LRAECTADDSASGKTANDRAGIVAAVMTTVITAISTPVAITAPTAMTPIVAAIPNLQKIGRLSFLSGYRADCRESLRRYIARQSHYHRQDHYSYSFHALHLFLWNLRLADRYDKSKIIRSLVIDHGKTNPECKLRIYIYNLRIYCYAIEQLKQYIQNMFDIIKILINLCSIIFSIFAFGLEQ
jgi:hypothetical protein